jgi:DNA-binding CsgD family transcriptional regulator/tetratricopeptide (TPR) repeat protein
LTAFDLNAAEKHYLEAVDSCEVAGDIDGVTISKLGLGVVKRYQGAYDEALAHLEQVQRPWPTANDSVGVAIAEHAIATVLGDAGNGSGSQIRHARALQLRREIGEPYAVAFTLISAATVDRWAGEHVAAVSAASEALAAFETLGYGQGSAPAIVLLALLAADTRRDSEALDLLQRAFSSPPGSLSVKATVEALELTAALLVRRGMARVSALLLSAATAHRRSRGLVAPVPERMNIADSRAAIAEALGVAAFSAAWGDGQQLSLDQAVALAVDAIVDPARATSPAAAFDLTRRELEVLSLLAEHLSDREIADRLFLSPRTIERHVSNILLKLETPNRRLAAALAVRERLVAVSQ